MVRNELKARALAHFAFFLLLWPLLSILFGTIAVREQPITGSLALQAAAAGVAAGALNLLPELLGTGAIVACITTLLFAAASRGHRSTLLSLSAEPLAGLLVIAVGFAYEYPALLRHALFFPLRNATVITALAVLLGLAVMIVAATARDSRRHLLQRVAVLALLLLLARFAAFSPAPAKTTSGAQDSVFLVGADSLSQSDPLPVMKETIAALNGTWYENPVAPGLLTNSVWTAIIQHRRVRDTGVFLTYQTPDWRRSPYHLIREARARGFETWSFFSDQFTTYVGSRGDFQVDRSGPLGWLQLATASMKDAHILSPVLLPRLPHLPLARTPRNQSGTFAFSLRRELSDIFTAGSQGEKVFVAAHLDYLHQPAYPSRSELSPAERRAVGRARVGTVWDLSLHWQYPELAGEPLGIYAWKMRNFERELDRALRASGVARPARRNRIILFSDHGNRKEVGLTTFGRRQYYKVLFTTIGIAPRDPRVPLSLLDIPNLLGWPDASKPAAAELVVEYTNVVTDQEWRTMMSTARLKRDGRVALDPRVTAHYGRRLLAYWPHRAKRSYDPSPSIPTELTLQR